MAGKGKGEHSAENGKLGGRPVATATLVNQKFREALAKRIERDAEKWMDAIQDSALGHFMMTKTASGEIKVYKVKPDPTAWDKVMDRAFGKPVQQVEIGEIPDLSIDV